MIIFRLSLVSAISLMAMPAVAQQINPVSPAVEQAAESTGLSGSVSDENDWQDLGIAIPDFATDVDAPTQTSAGSTGALGSALAQIISANLKNNGLFKPNGPQGLPRPAFGEVQAPAYASWSGAGAEMLVQGSVQAVSGGKLTIGCHLFDVALKQQLASASWTTPQDEWRRSAHRCADLVYSRLSGESPFFDSRIAYIAESGPKTRRKKQLVVMDSDGANPTFLTTGAATALTPRFSPDYRTILYLSYLNGHPRIYAYDVASKTQRLITQSRNPTFSPRWSPDGKWVLYSMAVSGNTDIYRISAQGGESVRLTNGPGIDTGGSYSPDGSKITFESDRSGSQQVYVMNADGSDQRRISFFGGRAATPEWSPRGDQIAFTHMGGNFRIAVMNPAGSDMRLLTDSWQDEAPTWAPNGRIIQFFRTTQGSGSTSVWQVDLTGRHERRLPTRGDGSDPAWGPIRP